MAAIPFVTLDEPRYGQAVSVSPLIRRVIANNPSKFTYHGTGTYIVGSGTDGVAVIDPGPRLDAHRDALLAALDGQQVTAILVTHCHADHAPLAGWLAEQTGAPTIGFGRHPRPDDDAAEEWTPIDEALAVPDEDAPRAEGEEREGVDYDFVPVIHAGDGDIVAGGDGWSITAVHTPGHAANHLCFALDAERSLFTGDHIMGWSTTVVSPPDGDMSAYIDSLHKVIQRGDAVLWPTHGAPVTDPPPFLAAYLAHRLEREAHVLEAIRSGLDTVVAIVTALYADVHPALHRPAARSVYAHIRKLIDDGRISAVGEAAPTAHYRVHG
ncbi:MAG TPA: MBL fold metallo-hydrolase [Ilumatobacteraceae bacterium]|nr:MBL fold metallo-hydrolase [Ilumatobacteraceae bacterium]